MERPNLMAKKLQASVAVVNAATLQSNKIGSNPLNSKIDKIE